jgi:polyisoprenoid-binding protein YceI
MKLLSAILSVTAGSAIAFMAGAAQLEINPEQSKIEVAVSSTVDSFVGHLAKYNAAIECVPSTVLPTGADLSFDFADLKTGNTDRDAAMLKWLQYDSNRTATFHLTGWNRAGTTNLAVGNLAIHGVSKEVQMPVVVSLTDTAWDISGETMIDYTNFKLPKIRKALFLTVNTKLEIKFHLKGKLAAAK